MIQVIMPKIQPPMLKGPFVMRGELLRKLQSYRNRKLVYINSPAGYGKTVLLFQFAVRVGVSAIWYQFDGYDNEPAFFFHHLIQSVMLGIGIVPPAKPDFYIPEKPQEILVWLIRILEEQASPNTLLILEDVHFLENREILQFIEKLVCYLPSGVQLLISSRYASKLKMAKLKMERDGVEIGPDDLAFTLSECKALADLSLQFKPEPELIQLIYQHTMGWPAGTGLFLNCLAERNQLQKIDSQILVQAYPHIYNYLNTEVYADLNQELRQILTKLAVAGEFKLESADQLLERNDSRFILQQFLTQPCFITTSLDVYRFHPLFREFLLSRLGETNKMLHHQAGRPLLKKAVLQHWPETEFMAEDYQNTYTFIIADKVKPQVETLPKKLLKLKQPVRLKILCFGGFEVYSSIALETPVNWRTNKAKELLAYFIDQRHLLSRQEIFLALWPDVPPEQAGTFLHTNLYFVRQILQKAGKDQGIVYENGHYRLEANEADCDIIAFDQLIVSVGQGDVEKDILMMEQAVALYRGDYLEHCDWEWATAGREEYIKKYFQLLQRLGSYYWERNNHRQALIYLEKMLKINPFMEEAHRMMMKAQAVLGDRQAVIRQYDSLRQILMDELGLEPARETSKLFYEVIGEVS